MLVTGVKQLPDLYLIVLQTLLPATKKSMLEHAFFEEAHEEQASAVLFFLQLFFLCEGEL